MNENWKSYELGNIVSIYNGSTPSTTNEEFWNGDIIWVTPKDLSDQNQKYISEGERKITRKALSKTKLLPKGTVLLSSRAPIGLLSISITELVTNQGFKNIVVDEKLLNNEFLYYNLKLRKNELNNLGTGTTFKELSKSTLEKFKINLPDLPTQKSIAKVLSDLDAKIELNNKINQELEAMAKTLYDYWFVQFDFPTPPSSTSGIVGKPYKSSGGKMVYNEELKREIPEGWEVKKLGDIIKKYADKSTHIESKNILNEGSYPVITQDNGDLISGFTNENNPIEDVPLIVFGDHSCTLRYIDFPFFRGADGTQIMYFEEDLTIYVYLFLQMIITQIPGYGKYERHYKYLKEFNIIIPKAKFLSEFQKIVEPIFNKISKSRLQNQNLTTLRDWLLPMLMNGQVASRASATEE
jgi:type I restriction enzyme S subunit